MKVNANIRELRRILGQTQDAFALTIGASKDTVASWETGRNRLSAGMARRIALATGVDEGSLLKPGRPLVTWHPARRPFTEEEFRRHQKLFWGGSVEDSVPGHLRRCESALELLLMAAARSDEGMGRLAGLLDAFHQWCEQAREDFGLTEGIEAQLAERKERLELNKSYAQWREMEKTDPDTARMMGFKDDPKRGGNEMLRLSMETVPLWKPGTLMRGDKSVNARL